MSRPFASLIKENLVLIAGLILPVLLILVFTLARALPEKAVASPEYKAVYAQQSWDSGYTYVFDIKNDGKLSISYKAPSPSSYDSKPEGRNATLYIFDAANDDLKTITIERPTLKKGQTSAPVKVSELEDLKLIKDTKAPDGYIFQEESWKRSSLVTEIFSYNNNRTPNALYKDGRIIPLRMNDNSYGSFSFIGWVAK